MFVSPHFYPALNYGGPVFSSVNLVSALGKKNIEVDVYTTNANLDCELSPFEMKQACLVDYGVKNLNIYPSGGGLLGLFGMFRDILFRSPNYDLVHCQYIFDLTTVFCLIASWIRSVPLVISPRGAFGGWCMKQGVLKKKMWLYLFVRPALKRIWWHVTSDQERNDVARVVGSSKIILVPNGLDINGRGVVSREELNERFPFLKERRYFLSVGRIHLKKGFDYTLTAFQKFVGLGNTDYMLLIVGPDYGFQSELESIIEKYGLKSNVFLVGEVSGELKNGLYYYSELFCLNSRDENFGNVYLEALSFGTPIIASIYTPWQIVESEGVGRCVENDPELICSAMCELSIEKIPCRSTCIRFSNKYSWIELAGEFVEGYRLILGRVGVERR